MIGLRSDSDQTEVGLLGLSLESDRILIGLIGLDRTLIGLVGECKVLSCGDSRLLRKVHVSLLDEKILSQGTADACMGNNKGKTRSLI